MSEPKVKATPCELYNNKRAWRGRYYPAGEWVTVKNKQGLPISYASPEAACAAAWLAAPDDADQAPSRT